MIRLSTLELALGVGVLAATIGFTTPAQATCDSENYVGSVCFTTAYYCPKNYLPAEGQLLSISEHEMLFSVIGFLYGGDNHTVFALPDLRGRSVVGTGPGPGLDRVQLGQKYGQERATLTSDTLPAHSHQWVANDMDFEGTLTIKATTATGTSLAPGGTIPAARPSGGPPLKRKPLYTKQPATSVMALDGVEITLPRNAQTEATGNTPTSSFELRPPQIAINACVAIKGIYPPRP